MMRPGEWSRSRHWHAHFLHHRHRRTRVVWDRPGQCDGQDVAHYLLRQVAGRGADAWIIDRAATRYPADPAYIQALRLLTAEQRHHDALIARLAQR